MNRLNPIFTEPGECQDCYKCIRECPVKAIQVVAGHASVLAESCVLCGHCVEVCPRGAKRVRSDLAAARSLIKHRSQVFVSLAPSFASELPDVTPGRLIAALRRLGFAGVSETALGAQEVSAHVRDLLRARSAGLLVSSACPTIVAYLQRYRPDLVDRITPVLSPLLAHCMLLRAAFGDDVGIVFIGPCIGKKREAEMHPDLLDVALTFGELRDWLDSEGIDLSTIPDDAEAGFVPESAHEGSLYPVEGGMIAATQAGCTWDDARFMAFSGLSRIGGVLAGIESIACEAPLFLELLACEGGCVNGPATRGPKATALRRHRILRRGCGGAPIERTARASIAAAYPARSTVAPDVGVRRIAEALATVGKRTAADEMNCGGCGYDSCVDFGRALIEGRAERTMCVTYMRKLAQQKAHALIQKMPAAVVIVDDELRIVEHNSSFARLFGAVADEPHEGETQVLEGRAIESVAPFRALFASVLDAGTDAFEKDLRHEGRILHATLFSIERGVLAGGIFEDITRPQLHREQIVRRARQVIQQNLKTVQQIAYLIGENAADSEMTLSSIIECFAPVGTEPDLPGDQA